MMSVLIIGGGMVGSTLALALSYLTHHKIRIDLVEAQTPSRTHPAFNGRAIALAQGTCRELMNIGLWSTFSYGATPINQVEVSDFGHFSKVRITASDYQIPALGYVLELHNTGIQLINLLRGISCIHWHCPAMLKQIKRGTACNLVILDNGCQLRSQLVVAADGSHSPLATQCGIRWMQKDYFQIAVVANINTALPHNSHAFERFTPHGPMALLPLSGNRNALVWCLPDACQKEVSRWDTLQFCRALQQVFGWRLGHITGASKHDCYPLRLRIAERHISHRLALVGNAAQTLHPVAGQGLNLGLRDAITLAEILAQATMQGEDLGDYSVLRRYQQRRKSDQAHMVSITDGLVHLFTNQDFPLVLCRNLGLLAIASIPSLRHMLVKKTLGGVER